MAGLGERTVCDSAVTLGEGLEPVICGGEHAHGARPTSKAHQIAFPEGVLFSTRLRSQRAAKFRP